MICDEHFEVSWFLASCCPSDEMKSRQILLNHVSRSSSLLRRSRMEENVTAYYSLNDTSVKYVMVSADICRIYRMDKPTHRYLNQRFIQSDLHHRSVRFTWSDIALFCRVPAWGEKRRQRQVWDWCSIHFIRLLSQYITKLSLWCPSIRWKPASSVVRVEQGPVRQQEHGSSWMIACDIIPSIKDEYPSLSIVFVALESVRLRQLRSWSWQGDL